MDRLEDLYSEIPPTKLRHKEEKFRKAKVTPFWLWVAKTFFYNMLENRFYAMRYKGEDNLKHLGEIPTILFAPHSNWWDGIVGFHLCHKVIHKNIRLMIEELNRFPVLRRGGAFSINKKSAQSSMESLKYSVDLLSDLDNVLYIYPEGIIKPPNHRPIEFQSGLTYIAQKAAKKYGKVCLVPVAVNYFFMRDNRPEVWAEFGEEIILDNPKVDRKEYTDFLAKKLEELCDKQFVDISNAKFEGYKTLFQQKLAWYRQIEQWLKRIENKDEVS